MSDRSLAGPRTAISGATVVLASTLFAACAASAPSSEPAMPSSDSAAQSNKDAQAAQVPSDSSAASDPAEGRGCDTSPRTLLTGDDLLLPGADSISAGMDLAVDGNFVYATVNYGRTVANDQGSALLRVPRGGGTKEVLARFDGQLEALLLTDDSAIVVESLYQHDGTTTGTIRKVAKDGGRDEMLTAATIRPGNIIDPFWGLASDGQYVYFTASDGVMRVPLSGGEAEKLSDHTGTMALIDDQLVIADASANALVQVAKTGGDAVTLAGDLHGDPGPITACGADTCWVSSVPGPCCAEVNGTITELAPDGHERQLPKSGELGPVQRMIYDDGDLFFTVLGDASSGDAGRMSTTGEPPTDLGSGSGIALDDECVYVGDVLFGVRSLPR